MWNKLSFQLKITFVFSLSLTLLTISLTAISLLNVEHSITNPMNISIINFDHPLNGSIHFTPESEFNAGNVFDLEQMLADINIHGEDSEFVLSDEEIERLIEEYGDLVTLIDTNPLKEQLTTSRMNFRQSSLWVAAVIILVGTGTTYWLAGLLVKPIKYLSSTMKEVDADQLGANIISHKGDDEISQLTQSFNGMIGKMHQTFESKQLFAQNAAHELKTPLTIIRADLEVLKMTGPLTIEDYEEAFVEVEKNTERMIAMVESLLAMGKNINPTDMTALDGRSLFVQIIEDLSEEIKVKAINVEIKGESTIEGDKQLLPQAFFNIVSNAIRYNVDGGYVKVLLMDGYISIEDTGVGIPSESINNIFDPFYCVDKSRSKKLGGTGLGLAITKNILIAHNMPIDVKSVVGKGTCVTIKLHNN